MSTGTRQSDRTRPHARSKRQQEAVLSLHRAAGNRAFGRVLARYQRPSGYPWIGRIKPWSAALRSGPAGPHGAKAKALVDLPRGTEVKVVNRKGGWLAVTATVDGTERTGYVSQELIEYVRMGVTELPELVVSVHVPTLAEALAKLKGLEKRRQRAAGPLTLDEAEQDEVDLAVNVIEKTKKYTVDHATYAVRFDRSAGSKTQVTTIEDFVLYVEEVERDYPRASPGEVASEIRQTWYSDPQWDILSAGQGIHDGSSLVDIETEAPVATAFDMKQIAPKSGSLKLATKYGTVDIGHVLAGIDLALNGMSSSYPKAFLKKRGDETWKEDAMFDALKDVSGGDTRDFATWSGDLGQAYAEYIFEHYVASKRYSRTDRPLNSLAAQQAKWATDPELLGDIHGYFAVAAWKAVPSAESPTGSEMTVSNILRDLYLTPRSAISYSLGKSGGDLETYITQRTLAFASIWYAGKTYAEHGYWGSSGLRGSTIIKNYIAEFYEHHRNNEAEADGSNKLGAMIQRVLKLFTGTLK